jgi:hypothetical protein
MAVSQSTFLSSWAQELAELHPAAALPVGGEAHGALSAHLLSKDDTTVFGELISPLPLFCHSSFFVFVFVFVWIWASVLSVDVVCITDNKSGLRSLASW